MQLQPQPDSLDDTGIGWLKERLVETQQDFREFAYRVSHDVNAPLRSVVNFSQLLADRCGELQLDDHALLYLDYIIKGVNQAQDMMERLLQYSRINTLANPPEAVDCNLAIERCLQKMKDAIKQHEAKITVDNLPEVFADPHQIDTLFSVLIDNALTFRSHERVPEIVIGAKQVQGTCVFWISDNGVGITPKHQQEIFQVFVRYGDDLQHTGLGMGLAFASKIIKQSFGRIWVESEVGRGATFYFTLSGDGDYFHDVR